MSGLPEFSSLERVLIDLANALVAKVKEANAKYAHLEEMVRSQGETIAMQGDAMDKQRRTIIGLLEKYEPGFANESEESDGAGTGTRPNWMSP